MLRSKEFFTRARVASRQLMADFERQVGGYQTDKSLSARWRVGCSATAPTTSLSSTTMEPIHRTAVLLWTFFVLFAGVVLAQGDPEHTVSYFRNLPGRVFFFEDQTVRVTRNGLRTSSADLAASFSMYCTMIISKGTSIFPKMRARHGHALWTFRRGRPRCSLSIRSTIAMCVVSPLHRTSTYSLPGLCLDERHQALPYPGPRQVMAFLRYAHPARPRRPSALISFRPQEVWIRAVPGHKVRIQLSVVERLPRRGTCFCHCFPHDRNCAEA